MIVSVNVVLVSNCKCKFVEFNIDIFFLWCFCFGGCFNLWLWWLCYGLKNCV